MIRFVLLLTWLTTISYCQPILSSGSIFEGESTPDKKISGLFTYMNNSDQNLILEIEGRNGGNSEILSTEEIAPRRGKQVRVYKQEYSSNEKQVFGDYTISFFTIDNQSKGKLLFQYNNLGKAAQNLRIVSVVFSGISEDVFGKYFDVRIDWQYIYEGTKTDNRKCYLIN